MNAGESPRNQGLSVKGAPVRFRRRSRGLRKNAAVERREVNALRTGVRRKALNRYRAFRRSAPLTFVEGAFPSSVFGPRGLVGRNRCRPRHRLHQGAPRVMELSLHANATTTPKTRAYIQRSRKPVAELAHELGVSETTIRRWRDRTTVSDRSHTPKTLTTSLSGMEEALICELRTRLQLPLDDVVEVMRRCVNAELSRSAIHRCLVRHGLNRRAKPDKPAIGVFEEATVGFIHIDLKHLPALEKHKSYGFVAIDRATRYVYLEIHPKRDAETSEGFLNRFLDHFPHPVHTILTDNGSEFTDRFAVDM